MKKCQINEAEESGIGGFKAENSGLYFMVLKNIKISRGICKQLKINKVVVKCSIL